MYLKIMCLLLLFSTCLLSQGMAETLRVECREGKCLLDMPREFLGRVFLAVSRLDDTKGCSTYQRGAALGKETALSFREGKPGTIDVFLHDYSVNIAESTPEMQRLLRRNRVEFPFTVCPLLDAGAERLTIDITEFLKHGEPLFEGFGKEITTVGSDNEKFQCTVIRSLPVVLRKWKRADDEKTDMPVTTAFFLLPEQFANARENHVDAGFAAVAYDYFKDERTGIRTRHLITRWLLSPADAEAWSAGQVTDVVEPIVFYLDPAIPKQWKSVFVQAVEAWQKAFEAAGFRRAIVAKDLPEGQVLSAVKAAILYHDSIAYETSDVVADPRSGQIVQVRLHWGMQLVDSLIDKSSAKTLTVSEKLLTDNLSSQEERLIKTSVCQLIGVGLGFLPTAIPIEVFLRDDFSEEVQYAIRWGYGPRL